MSGGDERPGTGRPGDVRSGDERSDDDERTFQFEKQPEGTPDDEPDQSRDTAPKLELESDPVSDPGVEQEPDPGPRVGADVERVGPGSSVDAAGGRETVLVAEDLRVSYGKVTALRGLDITVEEGEIVSLIGPNGAGKTTFCNTASGFLDYEGSVRYRGQEVRRVGQTGLVEQGMIHCTEERDLFGFMDVDDNLELGGYLQDDEVIEERKQFVYDLFPRLDERRSQNARSMSGGEQQMLAIGRALIGDPDLLVLDEPTLGLAPVVLQDIAEALDPILAQGVTILLTEQNVTFALEHADRIYLLENGEAVREGSPDDLQGDDYIRESYLGG